MTVTTSYRELSGSTGTPAGAVWGAFLRPDDFGMLNFLTADRTAQPTKLLRSGAVHNLDYPINTFDRVTFPIPLSTQEICS